MINILLLIDVLLIFLLVFSVVIRSIYYKIPIFGKPPVNVFFFISAKMMVVVSLAFFVMRGFNIKFYSFFDPGSALQVVALILLMTGTAMLYITTFQLNKYLIFGLSESEEHHLQTSGLFAFSRHPFYLGFILILFSACLFYPNPVNIIAFLGAWTIHHFIMIEEEKFLGSVYGETYKRYKMNVGRYITLKIKKS